MAVDQSAVEKLIAIAKYNSLTKIQNLQSVMNAAIFAAEQVQDKRIELLENGPEVNTSDILLDLFICFALESPLAGMAVKKVTNKVFSFFLRQKKLGEMLIPGQKTRNDLANVIRGIKHLNLPYSKFEADIARVKALTPDDYLNLRKYCSKLSRGSYDENWAIAGAKTAEAFRKTPKSGAPVDAVLSPGVSLLKSVYSYVSSIEKTTSMNTIYQEAILRSEGLNEKVFDYYKDIILSDFDEIVEESFDTEQIIEQFMYLFEAMIWAKICHFSYDQVNSNFKGYLEVYGNKIAGKRLMAYLKRRFEGHLDFQLANDPDFRSQLDSLFIQREKENEDHRDRTNRKFNTLFKYLTILDSYNASGKIDTKNAIKVSLPNYPK